MLRIARTTDPSGDYRLVPDDNLEEFVMGTCDLVFSGFTSDNTPAVAKARIFRDLQKLLKQNGVVISLVSSPEIYLHQWASFTTKDFPENAAARSGDAVRIIVTDHQDRRPVEDILCTNESYQGSIEQRACKPFGQSSRSQKDEPYPWVNETEIAPWVIYVLKRAT
jgi:hypothetical protein